MRRRVPDQLPAAFASLRERADVLVVTGDITNNGRLAQAELAAELLRTAGLPILAVLGNHDRRCLRPRSFRAVLERANVSFLDGDTFLFDDRLGFAGVAGSGGGWWPEEGPDTLTRRATQRLALRARSQADLLDQALGRLGTELKVVVTHFAPTMSTLGQEPVFKNWLLGNSALGTVIDRHDVDLVLHGHAHHGDPLGHTLGGTLVRNVAYDVTGGGIAIHELRAAPVMIPAARSIWSERLG